METTIGDESQHFYGSNAPDFVLKEKDLMGVGRTSMEWDLNGWKWDGNLFLATPLNSNPLNCRNKQLIPVGSGIPGKGVLSNSSSSSSDQIDVEDGRQKGELEKRRRVVVAGEDNLMEEDESLALKLGGHVYPIMESGVANGDGRKRNVQGPSSTHSVCLVDGCGVDLNNAREYHRRHKVCEMHSKATAALVSGVMQRFCQQCSRFHALQEFDEGKKSCRRRLAGHNKRRRKTHPDAVVSGNSLNVDQASSYLLITLLRILSNLHSNNSDEAKDRDLLSHLLRSLAGFTGTSDGRNFTGLAQASQELQRNGTSARTTSEAVPALLLNGSTCVSAQGSSGLLSLTSNGILGSDAQDHLPRPVDQSRFVTVAADRLPQHGIPSGSLPGGMGETCPSTMLTNAFSMNNGLPSKAEFSGSLPSILIPESNVERVKRSDIDLNSVYIDSQDLIKGSERKEAQGNLRIGSLDCSTWLLQDSHHSGHPQTNGNLDSVSAQLPSSSNGDAQSCTDRIVFKLFGKDPHDFPLVLRSQILHWLSHSPTDIESYIRPGCIILTIYLRLAESTWEELCCNLSSSLHRLVGNSNDAFWRTGWVYARVQHQMAFICNGQVVVDSSLPLRSHNHCRISSITPIAVSFSERANFTVKGFNLSASRLLCAFEGKYLVMEMSQIPVEGNETLKQLDEIQCISFSCSFSNATGRGFIEVEDDGLTSSFFPFIVAEQDLCSEICMLESAIEATECDGNIKRTTVNLRNEAMGFLHEMGWLLRRSHLWSRSDSVGSQLDKFPWKRFKCVMEFSMDHDWCAVVKKLLDVLFDGAVDAGQHSSVDVALLEMGLLHKAVRRNCRPMVEFLLRYVPDKKGPQHGQESRNSTTCSFLFRPDTTGPAGVTPLHVAASRDDAKNVLDALTNDPGQVGIGAWKNARDNSGFSPEDYACVSGYYSYIHLVRKKISKKLEAMHAIDVPVSTQMPANSMHFTKPTGFQIDKLKPEPVYTHCKICDQPLVYRTVSPLPYRPFMVSMLAVAAVCVCVGLILRSPPGFWYKFHLFSWELVGSGSR